MILNSIVAIACLFMLAAAALSVLFLLGDLIANTFKGSKPRR